MIKQNVRNMALFATVSSTMLAPVLLMIAGTSHLNQMLAVNCFFAAVLSSVLIGAAHIRAVVGMVLFGAALQILLPDVPLSYILAGSALGGLLAWAVPFLFQEKGSAN